MWESPTYNIEEKFKERCEHINIGRLTRALFAPAGFARLSI
jgi:hypothetical protein